VLACAGCGIFSSGPSKAERADASAARVLADLVDLVAGNLEMSGERIASQTDDLAIARLSVHYRMRLSRSARTTLGYRDPHVGLLDLWALCRQLEQFLTEGEGARLFGDLQPVAVASARQSLARVAAGGGSMFADDHAAGARSLVQQFAAAHPIGAGFARRGLQEVDVAPDGWSAGNTLLKALSLEWINPLSGFGTQVTEGAESVGAAMDRFTTAAEFLPRQLGWQLELFVYDLAGARPLTKVADGVARAASSVDAFVDVADGLPRRLGEEVTRALREVESTLAAVRASAEPIAQVGAEWAVTAQRIDAMAGAVEATLGKFDGTYRMLTRGDGDEAGGTGASTPSNGNGASGAAANGGTDSEGGRPFDILDWNRTAQSIESMCAGLQATLAEFQRTLADPELDGALTKAQRVTRGAVASAALTLVVSGAALVVLVFLGLWLLRATSRRSSAA